MLCVLLMYDTINCLYYRWLKQLNYYGVSLIQNMPAKNGVIAKVCPNGKHCTRVFYQVILFTKH